MSRITAIETSIPHGIMPNLMLLRIHTDDGLVGCGETYYTPHAIAALIHDWMAERLLGADALAVESHWRWLYERTTPFGHPGAELRAISAIDLALWDLLGQATGQPVYRLLGGPVRERIPVYNTCGGPGYGAAVDGKGAGPATGRRVVHGGWPGYGSEGKPGPLEDTWASLHAAGDLAEELVAEGHTILKLWPFDRAAHRSGGLHITWADVEEGMQPLRAIRDRVGMKLEIAIEGHAFFQLPAAVRIADALREIKPLWLEDVLRVDCVATLAEFRRRAGLPIAASEMLLARKEYLQVLQAGAADYCMIDPTWSGGISESRRVIEMAQAFNVPATIHDCTGPLTLLAGLHLAAASANVVFQETVRAHIRTVYPALVDRCPVVESGTARLPEAAGIGARFHDALFIAGSNEFRRTTR